MTITKQFHCKRKDNSHQGKNNVQDQSCFCGTTLTILNPENLQELSDQLWEVITNDHTCLS